MVVTIFRLRIPLQIPFAGIAPSCQAQGLTAEADLVLKSESLDVDVVLDPLGSIRTEKPEVMAGLTTVDHQAELVLAQLAEMGRRQAAGEHVVWGGTEPASLLVEHRGDRAGLAGDDCLDQQRRTKTCL